MLLLDDERRALITAISRYDADQFTAFLEFNGGPRLKDFSNARLHIAAIAVEFRGWIELHAEQAPGLLAALAVALAGNEETVVLAAAAERLRQLKSRLDAAGPATQARLVGGVPIVNRSVLRQHLEEAIGDLHRNDVKLVKVTGEKGLGRSHSWYLIKHVANTGVARTVKFDLVSATLNNQTLDVLFDRLTRDLNLIDARKPTTNGVTAETLAARFAEEVARCLGMACSGWDKPLWLVFDSLDRDLRPEIKCFISLLARARLDGEFDHCVIFLLGPDAFSTPDDPYRRERGEDLVAFNDADIRDAASWLNKLGVARLTEPELEARINAMLTLKDCHRGSEFCSQVASHLVDLRVTVRA